jgi:hypothetical protein
MIEEWVGVADMAAMRDIQGRAIKLGATATYMTKAPRWLTNAARAALAGPVIINIKGTPPDSTPVLVTLAELERLAGTRSALEGATADELAILAPDMPSLSQTIPGGEETHT